MSYRSFLKKTTYLFIFMILFFTFFSKTINNINTPRVKTCRPENGYLIKTVRGRGQSIPERSTRLYLPASLIIDEILVNPGERINKGTALFRLNESMVNSIWETEYLNYYKKILELEQANEALLPCKSDVHNLNELKKRFLMATEDRDVKTELYKSGYILKRTLDEADIFVELAEAEYQSALKNDEGNRLNEEVRLRNVERSISLLEKDVSILERNVNTLEELRRDPIFLSPVNGTIIKIHCTEGILNQKEDPVISLINSSSKYVFTAEIDSSLIEDVKPGDPATLYLNKNREIEGHLLSISPHDNGQSSNISFSMDDEDLNGSETGYFIIRRRSSYYDCIIPKRALRGSGRDLFLYITEEKHGALSKSNIIKKCRVRLLDSSANRVAVSGDVHDDARIVYDEDRNSLEENERVIEE